jgi:Chain length determinant protein
MADGSNAAGSVAGLVGLIRRRWPLVLALLVLTGVAGVGILRLVPPDYETTASAVLVPPQSRENPGGNRYLLLGGMTPARDVVIRSLTSEQTRKTVLRGTPRADYVVEPDFATSAPLIIMTATAPTPRESKAVIAALVKQMPKTLVALQDDLSTGANSRIAAQLVSQDAEAKRVGKGQIRAVVGGTGALLVGGLLLIGLLDGVRSRPDAADAVPEPTTARHRVSRR